MFCDEDTPCEDPTLFCDVNGEFPASEGIGNTCIPSPFDAGVEINCEPNSTVCVADMLVVCDADAVPIEQTPCPLACHDTEPRCNEIDPSNDLAMFLDMAVNAPAVVLTDGAIINTDGTVTNGDGASVDIPSFFVSPVPDGVGITVFALRSLDAGIVDIEGGAAVAIVSDGDVHLEGTLSVAGDVGVAGPGAAFTTLDCNGGVGPAQENPFKGAGGGGGGYRSPGGRGGSVGVVPSGAPGGASFENPDLVPLRGGCGGEGAAVVAS